MRRAPEVLLSADERLQLEAWTGSSTVLPRIRIRARVILAAAQGRSNGEIARLLGVHAETVVRWRRRFIVNRLEGVRRDAPRSGTRHRVSPSVVERILRTTTEEKPGDGSTWSTRSLARALEVNHMLVHRVWKSHGLLPSGAPVAPTTRTIQARADVVGFFLNEPAAAIVFAVGPSPLASDTPPTHPRVDPDRSGAYGPLVAGSAMEELSRFVTTAEELVPRAAVPGRSPVELLVFLRRIEEAVPVAEELHLILDRPLESVPHRLATWLGAHPRFILHPTDANTSWAVAVNGWAHSPDLRELSADSFRNVVSLTSSVALPDTRSAGSSARRFSWVAPREQSGQPIGPVAATVSSPRSAPAKDEMVRPSASLGVRKSRVSG